MNILPLYTYELYIMLHKCFKNEKQELLLQFLRHLFTRVIRSMDVLCSSLPLGLFACPDLRGGHEATQSDLLNWLVHDDTSFCVLSCLIFLIH